MTFPTSNARLLTKAIHKPHDLTRKLVNMLRNSLSGFLPEGKMPLHLSHITAIHLMVILCFSHQCNNFFMST
ncbi:CLUMA_CG014623, isoform A [Clunio marinus]|uniref:CLUMA_CG014623, isoform A n=1 Tax=Clunio marinus TaxID=568069 RepID=A0A1J1ILA2_9DIPT|nr:CLUMA_CG014623, isoform A [Clunio marinus]